MVLTPFLSRLRFFSEDGKVPDTKNLFESSFQGTIYVSFFNAEVTKTVNSLIR